MFLCNEKIYILKVSHINVLISKVSDMPLTEDGISFFRWVYPYVGRTVLISTSPVFFFCTDLIIDYFYDLIDLIVLRGKQLSPAVLKIPLQKNYDFRSTNSLPP